MGQQKHQKHAKLTKPDLGYFCRNEFAIIGTPCGNIQQISNQLLDGLGDLYKVGYVDADHAMDEAENKRVKADQVYTDKISHHQLAFQGDFDRYQYRQWFNGQDLVIVNGNHFKASKQIVVLDPKKKESLSRKLDRLTDVALILVKEPGLAPYDFLKEHLPNIEHIPTWGFDETDKTIAFLRKHMEQQLPPIYGLVLAGGKSVRMGTDKGLIDYHGKPQREYVADLLSKYCDQTFISCRPEQLDTIKAPYQGLGDTFTGLGPFGAIASAFQQNPNVAWLVVACDLPLLQESTLQQLVSGRNPSKVATAFQSPHNEFPEPLISIWEPRSYTVLLQFLAQAYSCPRKVLINSDIELLQVEHQDALTNVNRPEEKEAILRKL